MSEPTSASTALAGTQNDPATAEEAAATPWEARWWIISCLLATLGALLFALSTWMPWISAVGYNDVSIVNGQQQFYRFLLSPADIDGSFGLFGGSLLSVVGLLLLPFLWQHRSRLANLLALLGYAIWAVLLLVYVTANSRYFQKDSTVHLVSGLSPRTVIFTTTPTLQFGYWLHFAATGIVTIAVVLMLLTMLPGAAWARLNARNRGRMRPGARIAGMGTLTFALIVWAAGIFFFPWATVNCTATPLVIGTCQGLPFDTALHVGIAGHTTSFDPLVSLYAVGLLLGLGAALICLASWTSRITRGFFSWVALWLLVATFIALVANAGVGLIVANPVAQHLPVGKWAGDDGAVVTFLGLLIGWGALLYLILTAGRHTSGNN